MSSDNSPLALFLRPGAQRTNGIIPAVPRWLHGRRIRSVGHEIRRCVAQSHATQREFLQTTRARPERRV